MMRTLQFVRKHGLGATVTRIGVEVRRRLYMGKQVIFSCDLPVAESPDGSSMNVERIRSMDEKDISRILDHWNPGEMKVLVRERFRIGAHLWIVRDASAIAAYGWTIRGRAVNPYFFPLLSTDVHLFDFFVFPEFRGRGINPKLVTEILKRLGEGGARRAYIESAAWNTPQLRSLSKTQFEKVGQGRQFCKLGVTAIVWGSK